MLQIAFFSILSAIALAACYLAMRDVRADYKQRRIMAGLRRDFDAMARIQAPVVKAGTVITAGDNFVLTGDWQFLGVPNVMSHSRDNTGISRAFGYTRDELIYIATHPSEFENCEH